jgi:hypothetical protein
MLDGAPLHILIIVGFALTLLAPLILNFKGAALAAAQAELDKVNTMKELDRLEFKRQQEEERRKSPEDAKYKQALEAREDAAPPPPIDPSLPPEERAVREEIQRKEQEEKNKDLQELKRAVDENEKRRKRALEKKQEELDNTYETITPRREIAEATTAVAGTRSHLVIGWLGRLLLLLGLLILTLRSDGLRQKVLLIVLLVVMFSALSGVNLDFLAQGRLGEPPRVTERSPQPSTTPK